MKYLIFLLLLAGCATMDSNKTTTYVCPMTKLYTLSGGWTDQDDKSLKVAEKTCARDIYNPCLKVFTKKETGLYSALCGVKDAEN